jgi:hypothetical protein
MRSGRWQRWINSFWLLALSLAFAASTSGKLQPGAGLLVFLAHPQDHPKSHRPQDDENDQEEMGLPGILRHWDGFKRRIRTRVLLQIVHVRISTDYTTA